MNEIQEKNTAKKRFEDNTHIYFTSEQNAVIWLTFCLEQEPLITEFKTEYAGKTLYFDMVYISNMRKRKETLTVLELKRDVVTLQHIYTKLFRNYPQAIVNTFGIPARYELVFVGSEITAEAEYFLDDYKLEENKYPTRSGVLKPFEIKFKTYEEILDEYYRKHNVTNLQAKKIRNTYAMLSGHRDRLPWIG